MEDQQTCGKGLAEYSVLPAKLAGLIDSAAGNLEIHMQTLDLSDENSRREYNAYQKLADEHREIATRLGEMARKMAGYRDLPMGKHDQKKMSDPKVLEAFKKYTALEQEVMAVLDKRVEQDEKMIAEMQNH